MFYVRLKLSLTKVCNPRERSSARMSSIKYCPKCHKEAYRLREEGDSIEVIQGSRTVLNLNNKSSVSMSFSCPSGHPVKMETNPKVKD